MSTFNIVVGILGILLTGIVIYLTVYYNKRRRIDSVVENYATGFNTRYTENYGCIALKTSGISELSNKEIIEAIERIEKRTGMHPLKMDQGLSDDEIKVLYKKPDIAGIFAKCNSNTPIKVLLKNN